MTKSKRKVTSSGSVSECLGALYDLEAQVAGSIALIGIEYRRDDPYGSLLRAVLLLNRALAMSDELRKLIEPEVRKQATQLALVMPLKAAETEGEING
jgi:hypothetical protein